MARESLLAAAREYYNTWKGAADLRPPAGLIAKKLAPSSGDGGLNPFHRMMVENDPDYGRGRLPWTPWAPEELAAERNALRLHRFLLSKRADVEAENYALRKVKREDGSEEVVVVKRGRGQGGKESQ